MPSQNGGSEDRVHKRGRFQKKLSMLHPADFFHPAIHRTDSEWLHHICLDGCSIFTKHPIHTPKVLALGNLQMESPQIGEHHKPTLTLQLRKCPPPNTHTHKRGMFYLEFSLTSEDQSTSKVRKNVFLPDNAKQLAKLWT